MKKFLKVFSLLAVICCSMFVFTGCTINLSEEQKEKVMTVVDNADVFMEDVLENLDKSNSKLGREESFKILQEAQMRILLNVDDIWSNMKATTSYSGLSAGTSSVYRVADGNYVQYRTEPDMYNVIFSDIESSPKVSQYGRYYEDGEWVEAFSTGTVMNFNYYLYDFNILADIGEFTVDNVLFSGVKDNGNNYITLLTSEISVSEDGKKECLNSSFVEVEIKNGFMQSVVIYFGTTEYTGAESSDASGLADIMTNPFKVTVIYEYGTVDGEEIEAKYKEARDYIAEHN
ncbi:MAG: hypothetical protein IJ458_01040 [Clostridia bacterium]|nr:hypothetical protein [Clostridia bacterium]